MSFRIHYAGLFLAICACSALNAQNPTASLVGNVTDATGAAIPAAKLQIRNVNTNETRDTNTDRKGEFAVTNLAPGSWEIIASKEGFKTLHRAGLELQMEQSARLEL